MDIFFISNTQTVMTMTIKRQQKVCETILGDKNEFHNRPALCAMALWLHYYLKLCYQAHRDHFYDPIIDFPTGHLHTNFQVERIDEEC